MSRVSNPPVIEANQLHEEDDAWQQELPDLGDDGVWEDDAELNQVT